MSEKLDKAIELATQYHKGQFRKDGKPYITHPLAVMEFLRKNDFPEDALIAAVLHDVCEDTNVTNLHINELFGDRVGFIINALSKNKKPKDILKLRQDFELNKDKEKISNLETYKTFEEYIDFRFHLYLNRLYIGIIAEPWILFIKIADQIHNLSDMQNFTPEKKLRKINEVKDYFLPIYEKCEEIFIITKKSHSNYNLFIKNLNLILNQK